MVSEAPAELLEGKLARLGEGIGKVVYASQNWVVKRERSDSEVLALIAVWKFIRRVEHLVPPSLRGGLVEHPSRQLRLLHGLMLGVVRVLPRGWWIMRHIGEVWTVYTSRSVRGDQLAETHLHGTDLIPRQISFPPVRVRVGGWPGWLVVSEATERVEATLHQRLATLARNGRWGEVETWLERFLELRQTAWRRGTFSVDAHLKNFGITGDRVVLIDTGGLTDSFQEIDDRLRFDERIGEPHAELGLARILAPRPDIARRFDTRWKAVVNREAVRSRWPVDWPE
jgi:hypothetical protein